ncbi:sulfotransferase [Pycnococcus provasolii]
MANCWRLDWGDTPSSLMNHPLSGITLLGLLRFVKRHRKLIDWQQYWRRLVFITAMSMFNTCLSVVETVLYGGRIHCTYINPRVVFVLGQPRSGTTHIHNLLSQDKERFAVATTFDVGFPSSFLWTAGWLPFLLQGLLSETRPMDNMRLSWELPQEDELATNQLSGGVSPYAAISFLRREAWEGMFPWWTLRREDGCTAADRAEWQAAFLYFLKKLQYRSGPNKRLLLKSPVHTARIHVLNELFPRARFICVHRDPYVIFRSGLNMASKYYGYAALSTPSSEDVFEYVLRQGEVLVRAYIRDASRILGRSSWIDKFVTNSPGTDAVSRRLVEIAFTDLDEKPLEALTLIYGTLRLCEGDERCASVGSFPPVVERAVSRYLDQLGAFKKNALAELDADAAGVLKKRWRQLFSAFGYDTRRYRLEDLAPQRLVFL